MAVFVWYKVSEVSRIGRKMLKYNYLKLTHVMLAHAYKDSVTLVHSLRLCSQNTW